jgi:hypothetical protein
MVVLFSLNLMLQILCIAKSAYIQYINNTHIQYINNTHIQYINNVHIQLLGNITNHTSER